MSKKIFRQFFDKQSSTYTYLIGDLKEKVAVFIDTVKEQVEERELPYIQELGFEQIHLLSTHIHADHITGNAVIKTKFIKNATQSYVSTYYNSKPKADVYISEKTIFQLGCIKLSFLHTPGHTSGCICIVDHEDKKVFTGDTLLIRGCGRTDFQEGSSEQLYDSVHNKLFKLPRDYLVYPAHDYKGRTVSSIGEEMDLNPRLTKTKEEFVNIMSNLCLAYPKLIDVAVPANMMCGFP